MQKSDLTTPANDYCCSY